MSLILELSRLVLEISGQKFDERSLEQVLWILLLEFVVGLNHESLSTIENALEVIYLDDEERFYDEVIFYRFR